MNRLTPALAGLCASFLLAPGTADAQGPQDRYMADVFLFAVAPRSDKPWCPASTLPADGRLMTIANNYTLFALYGDQFGGDGITTFGLPDMRGRTPVGTDYTTHGPYRIGATGGVETTTLGPNVLAHQHRLVGSSADPSQGSTSNGGLPDKTHASNTNPVYASDALSPGDPTTTVQMQSDILSTVGAGAGFTRLQPSLVFRYCVRTSGYFPSRN
jgi:microcystin-dependent protein